MSRRFLVLTPGLAGSNGIAALSRLVVRAVAARQGQASVAVVSLAEPCGAAPLPGVGAPVSGAGGSKGRFAISALRHAWRQPASQVICLHLHLSPVLSMMPRATRSVTVLCGVEAWKPLRPLERRALTRAADLVAISVHTARRFREVNPAFAGRTVHVCHPAIAVRARKRPAARGSAPPTALIVGRMAAAERYNGHDLLLEIWPRVVAQVAGVRLLVVGDGDDRPRLEARAAQLGLGQHVTFLGHVSDEHLDQLYDTSDVFVMPSRGEGFGFVFLEAMHAGMPCVGGTDAAAEISEDGVSGFVVDPARADEVLAAVVRLLTDARLRLRMGQAAARRIAAQFAEPSFHTRWAALLQLSSGTDHQRGATVA